MGVYEIPLTAGTAITVQAQGDGDRSVVVAINSSTTPVYARAGSTVTVQDPYSVQVPPATYAKVGSDITNTIAIISASAAVVSVMAS